MVITLRDIHKHYGSVRANDGISMEIPEGCIHGLLGENGAGKSTLMKVLAGYVRKTGGSILLNGKPTNYRGPGEATRLGIGMLYQEPMDFPPLTVLENFMIGRSSGLLGHRISHRRQLERGITNFGFRLDPDTPVNRLTVGERQQLEILRLMALGVEILILDEPTTGISPLQRQILFEALKKLAGQQKTILLVSHKLDDVDAVCDRVTVLRQGKVAGEIDRPFQATQLLRCMFGTAPASPPCPEGEPGDTFLAMDKVSAPGGRAGLSGCTVSIREREVVGLAGLEGSGQGLFLRLAAGLIKPLKGSIRLRQQTMMGRGHHAFKKCGITFVPTARLEEGLISGLTITEHFALKANKGIIVPWLHYEQLATERIDRFRVIGTPSSFVDSLSGGNQQRLLLALMPTDPAFLLLEHPTRGLDVESAQWVWQQLVSYAAKGTSIVFSSAELEEIFQVASRILVFYEGVVVKDTLTCNTTHEEIGKAIAGKA